MTLVDRFGNILATTEWIFDSEHENFEIELFNESKDVKVIITKIGIPPDFAENSQFDVEYSVQQLQNSNRVIEESEIQNLISGYCNDCFNKIIDYLADTKLSEQIA